MNDFDVIIPGVSVLMTVYNTKVEWLKEAIDSILQQTYKNFELVVVNDGSINEETNKTLIDYASQNPIINLITFEKNLGRVTALNEGLKKCKNDLIFIFDSDDIAYENAIKEQIKCFFDLEHNNKDVALLGCQLNVINSFTKVKKYSTNHPFKISKKNFHEIKDKYWFVNHPGCLIKKSVLLDKKINGYNENLNNSFPEDFDLYLRLIEEGYSIYNSNNVLYDYRVDDNKDSLNKKFQNDNKIYEKQSILIKNLLSKIDEENLEKYKYTIVSALIPNLNSSRKLDAYLLYGKELLILDIPKIIFLPSFLHEWAIQNSNSENTKIISFEKEDLFFFEELKHFKNISDLPELRNLEKDNFEYLLCQNNKINWLKKAQELTVFSNENYMWLDFGISHILKNEKKLSDLLNQKINFDLNKVLMPTHKNWILREDTQIDLNKINWFLLGGTFLINKDKITEFYDLCKNQIIENFQNQNLMSWEVNIWAQIMQKNPQLFQTYFADHDYTILSNMPCSLIQEDYYNICSAYRQNGKNHEALKYYELAKKDNEYYLKHKEKLDYEMTILNYYCFHNQKTEGLKFLIKYLNQYSLHEANVWTNLKYYIQTLRSSSKLIKRLESPDITGYINSSPCKLIMKNGKEYINIRNVNYSIQKDSGQYFYYNTNTHMSWENTLKNPVHTINVCNNQILEEINLTSYAQIKNSTIKGIEDVRIFEKDNKIMFLATTRDFSIQNRICTGQYLPEKNQILIEKVFNSPENSNCEKNWVMLNENEIIYKWYPLTVYSFDTLQKIKEIKTPTFFKHFRGGSNVIQIEGFNYCVVHTVHYENPRKYLHLIVKLNHEGYPLAYSVPFDFEGERIEYCLSMNYLTNGNLEFHYSTWDSSSKSLEIPFEYFNDKFIEV